MAGAAAFLLHMLIYKVKFAQFMHLPLPCVVYVQFLIDQVLYKYFVIVIILLLLAQFCIR